MLKYIAGVLLLTGIVSLVDGIKAAGIPLEGLYNFFGQYIPMFNAGMGWLVPALVGARDWLPYFTHT